MAFGMLEVPDRVVLYEQPLPTWRLTGTLAPRQRDLLTLFGGVIGYDSMLGRSCVD
ncbi:MAG: hypothetical protein ACK54C_10115 [Betaproteobacteria bacterium]